MNRFNSEQQARDHAQQQSEDEGRPVYVIESPDQSREGQPRGRFVTDTDAFVRSWEREICCYNNGVEE